ncbi:SMI1/KNR4 family protein [Saccharothrix australiensis]|uniref:Cell wall assembly regulator SMI1 n=1 Tax=Saccharothrix australiensis TaxID=2072 RepID=A0A495VZM9_9PSEU|nr:SMI1/KNR4 family protein [Saccharothrix australiensis]RKT54207.1 cell wall assembly regulator SMI1 [Saccharothrix australiensis]
MTAQVSASWDRIEEWCRDNGIQHVLRPPAAPAGIAAAEAEVGHRFPADLVESLRCHDGTSTRPMNFLVPTRWTLLPLARVVEDWRRRTAQLAERQAAEVDDMGDEDDEDWSDVEEGEEDAFWGWHPAWLPIALDDTGCSLVVELREGDRLGAVGQLDPQSNPRFDGVNTYPSVAALLAYTADALHGSGTATATAENDGVHWR